MVLGSYLGAFFVFPDLSIRTEGLYRVKFVLYEILDDRVIYCASINSQTFRFFFLY
jgi:hypothetical protein